MQSLPELLMVFELLSGNHSSAKGVAVLWLDLHDQRSCCMPFKVVASRPQEKEVATPFVKLVNCPQNLCVAYYTVSMLLEEL